LCLAPEYPARVIETSETRPAVSVVVPFAGGADDAARVQSQLLGLALAPGDELILADNSPEPVAEAVGGVRVVRADAIASSYYARNTGAAAAGNEWIMFVDSDCLLPATLVDDYFAAAPAGRTGLLAGEIEGEPTQTSLIARYHRSRGHLGAEAPLELGPSPAAGTANVLVRRSVWRELDGFEEVVSGADFEFSWRAGAAGWGVEHRPEARVRHLHPETLGAMRRKAVRYGAGQRWLEARYPGVPRPPGLVRELVRAAVAVPVWTLTARFERAAFKTLDAAWISAYTRGWRHGENTPAPLRNL
jgi:GT2 family glycosyltransferase